MVLVIWWCLYRTRADLWLRATNEKLTMVDAAGLSGKGLVWGIRAARSISR